MKKSKAFKLVLCSLCLMLLVFLSGCGEDKSGNTINEPEITTEYLSEEYSQQLMTDGAEKMLGFVTISKEDDAYIVHIIEKEVIASSDYDEGYYIADTNLTKDAALGLDARIVCRHDGELTVSNADDFIEHHPDGSDQLYTVYLMGDSAELILATEPESAMIE